MQHLPDRYVSLAALACLLIAPACGSRIAASPGITDTSASPWVKIHNVGLDDVRWTTGFWAARAELCRTAILPAVEKGLLDPRNSEQLRDLRIAAGLEEGKHRGTHWGDGDCYKWLEGVALAYSVTKDPALDRRMDEWIAVIEKAQAPDGYLSTNRGSDPAKRFQVPSFHELYNMGHLLHAACIHYRATGKKNFLALAIKTADYLDRTFRPRPPRLVHFPWNPSVYMGLVELYRTTRERRYLELLRILIDNRGSSPGGGTYNNGGTDQTQDRVPIREETEAVGHAVCATYLYCGAADLYAETGEAALLSALERIWGNVTSKKLYITGGIGPGVGKSSRGDPVHEAFLDAYDLPTRSAYCETCANIGNAMWNFRMLGITGDARYADAMEQVLYNSMLSAVSLDGKGFFYCNPLRWTGEEKGPSRHHSATRWSIYDCYCCPPQVARTLAGLHAWAYGVSGDGVWVHIYGGSTLDTRLPDGSRVKLVQATRYPWQGQVRITVAEAPARKMGLHVRIPAWARGARLLVNGMAQDRPPVPGTYYAVSRKWAAGDTVELRLPLEVRLVEAHPKVREIKNNVAVMRGPLVYCLELPRREGGESVWSDGVFLPENIEFVPRFEPEFLGGVVVLSGRALTFKGRDLFLSANAGAAPARSPPDWGGRLYRTFHPRKVRVPDSGLVDIRLIPYFAWANRGTSFMEVWMPLAGR